MFEAIGIKNWRSIGNTEANLHLDQITVIVGANDTGKSSYLLGGYALTCFLSEEKDLTIEETLNLKPEFPKNYT